MYTGEVNCLKQNKGMRQFNGEKAVLPAKIISHVNVKKKIHTDLYGAWKANSCWIREINIKSKLIKLSKENVGENLFDLEFGNEFLTPKAWSIIIKIAILDLIKHSLLKTLLRVSVFRKGRPLTKGKILINHVLAKGLGSQIDSPVRKQAVLCGNEEKMQASFLQRR